MQYPAVGSGTKKWMAPFFTIWGGQAISLLGNNIALPPALRYLRR